jgi:hypothetical protein
MIAARRVYLYLVAFVGLMAAAWGVAALLSALLNTVLDGGASVGGAEALRRDVAWSGASLLVGLPIWLLHWTLAARPARAQVEERRSTLRRLYLYGVMVTMLCAAAAQVYGILRDLFGAALGTETGNIAHDVARHLPWLATGAVLWLYHRHAAVIDRGIAGEEGGSATVRRWYVYGASFIGFVWLLNAAGGTIRIVWEDLAAVLTASPGSGPPYGLDGAAAGAVVALGLWVTHWSLWAAGPPRDELADQDARSILKPLYLFGALAVSVGFTLGGFSRLLYYILARLLGVANPDGVGENLAIAMAAPTTTALIYGAGWLIQRRALAEQAAAHQELPSQAGVRRLYTYLVALIAMALVATGAGGLLWTVADLLTKAPNSGDPAWWREQVSVFATLLLVGVPVWVRHWGPVALAPDEPRSLARRIYLYVTLGAAVLSLLGAGIASARVLLLLVLGDRATGSVVTDLARSVAVAVVAAIVVAPRLDAPGS